MASLGGYMENLKKRNSTRVKRIRQAAQKEYERGERANRAKEKVNSWPRDYLGNRARTAEIRDRKLNTAGMNEAQREEYGQPKEPARPVRSPMARSEKEAREAYREKTIPGYKESQAQYKRYLRENPPKNAQQIALERGKGPRKGYIDEEDYKKIYKNRK